MDETTQPGRPLTHGSAAAPPGEVHALVLIWSRDEPERAGEVVLIPPDQGAPWTFGRGEVKEGDGARALGLVRQRPGCSEPTRPLACPRISRTQLRLSPARDGALRIENAGRCPLIYRDVEVAAADVLPGDIVELRHELVFLCMRRPRHLDAPEPAVPLHPFGAADAFGFVGEGCAIWALRRTIQAIAALPAHVLLLGPSGSGKELLARALHASSARARRPLVARNAATIPEGLVDAELFGHAKNFPNAGVPERPGLVGEADGGTLFLDEIAELPVSLQAHLLRVLDDGEYHRLGETRARRADIRLVGATNRPEQAMKHDLLARMKARIRVPDLDARRDDIPLLAAHLLRRQAAGAPSILGRFFPEGDAQAAPRVAPDLMTALVRHEYRTHVRELDALLLASSIDSRGKYLELTEGVKRLLREAAAPPPKAAGTSGAGFTPEEQRRLALQRKHRFNAAACERDPEYGVRRQTADLHLRQLMARALAMADWDAAAAASMLAGSGPDEEYSLSKRLETFLANLRRRIEEEGREALLRSLANEWRGSAASASALVEALEGGLLRRAGSERV